MASPSVMRVLLATSLAVLGLPSLVFLLVALVEGMGADSLAAFGEQLRAPRNNLAVASLLGLFPVLLLAAFVGLRRLVVKADDRASTYALAGAVPILLVVAFVHYEHWSNFLPSRTFMGFPHGLELLIGPGLFAPVGIVIALFAVWLTSRFSR